MDRVAVRAWLREALLTGGAVLGVVCVLAVVGSSAFGLRPLIFRSGSMEPAIGTGALALARSVPADTVAPGDVVSVIAASGTRITHRVVSVSPGPVSTLILKGDANKVVDAEAYAVARVDRIVAHVEHLGYVVSWLRHPAVIFLGGVLLGIFIMITFTTRGPPSIGPSGALGSGGRRSSGLGLDPADRSAPRRARRSWLGPWSWRRRLVGLAAVASLMIMVSTSSGTRAAFQDTAQAATGAFATPARITTPGLSCTGLGVLAIRFSWDSVSDATGYDLVLTVSGGGSTTYTTAAGVTALTVNGVLSSGTAIVRAKIAYPSTTWHSAASNTRSYTFAAASLCS